LILTFCGVADKELWETGRVDVVAGKILEDVEPIIGIVPGPSSP
jgi:hypothetical protein